MMELMQETTTTLTLDGNELIAIRAALIAYRGTLSVVDAGDHGTHLFDSEDHQVCADIDEMIAKIHDIHVILF